MYYAYTVVDGDGDIHRGLVCAESFVDAMNKIYDYYIDICATSVLITCVTVDECYDVDDISDDMVIEDEDEDEDEDDAYDYDSAHGDNCNGNVTIKAHTTITPHLEFDADKLDELIHILDKLSE